MSNPAQPRFQASNYLIWTLFRPMPQRLILLTDNAFLADLKASLGAATAVEALATLDELRSANPTNARLVSFGSGVIVPPDVLGAFSGPSYNFHPGPPEYRGLFPSVFALYDNATTFGVTCHEMSAAVDSGAIVAVDRFAIPNGANREALDALTYRAMLSLVERLAAQIGNIKQPLPKINQSWSGPMRTRADFNALCQLPKDVDAAEFQRRTRAIGEGPNHAISIELFGRRFKLDSRPDATVVRGGREIS